MNEFSESLRAGLTPVVDSRPRKSGGLSSDRFGAIGEAEPQRRAQCLEAIVEKRESGRSWKPRTLIGLNYQESLPFGWANGRVRRG